MFDIVEEDVLSLFLFLFQVFIQKSFTLFLVLNLVVLWRVASSLTLSRALWLLPVMFVVAEVITDFVSGLSHW
jgi:hypothetical protein